MPPGRQEAKKEEEEEEKAPPSSRSNNGDDKDFPLIYAVKTCCFSPCPVPCNTVYMFMPISEFPPAMNSIHPKSRKGCLSVSPRKWRHPQKCQQNFPPPSSRSTSLGLSRRRPQTFDTREGEKKVNNLVRQSPIHQTDLECVSLVVILVDVDALGKKFNPRRNILLPLTENAKKNAFYMGGYWRMRKE